MRRNNERGSAMLLVFLMASVVGISLYLEIPRVARGAKNPNTGGAWKARDGRRASEGGPGRRRGAEGSTVPPAGGVPPLPGQQLASGQVPTGQLATGQPPNPVQQPYPGLAPGQ